MKLSRIENSHHITLKEKKYLGGKFPWLKSLAMGGTGSPQFLYHRGIEKWDELDAEFEHKTICSIELLQKGIVIWWNKLQNIRAALIPYEEIINIEFESFKVDAQPLVRTTYILDAANLSIHINDVEKKIQFYIPAPKHKKVLKFLQKNFKQQLSVTTNGAVICSEDPLYTSTYLHGLNY